MSSNEALHALTPEDRRTLLALAHASVRKGLCGEELQVKHEDYPPALQVPRASFVTLKVEEQLRGCIGSLEARHPLVVDVVRNAYAAAFRDPRFPALTWPEFERLGIHLSLLNPAEPLPCCGEADLLARLRPGLDGLILEEGVHRGTFLPSVWESLPDPRDFLRHLKLKAGLPAGYWSDRIRVQRYTVESIS
jgi:AmmeMemoRadiSam system protein A